MKEPPEPRVDVSRTQYVADADLGYPRIRWRPSSGEALRLDANYLTAHLPLIDQAHPDVIDESPDGVYQNGCYLKTRFSLVLPVSIADLQASPVFQRIDRAVRAGRLSRKIAWRVMEQRQSLMHATICGGLKDGDLPSIASALSGYLENAGPLKYRIGGPLVGQKNTGRLYFPIYPECRGGKNAFNDIQDALNLPRTDIYLVGHYNLSDHLDVAETEELSGILQTYGAATLLDATVREVWLLGTNDDLVLSGKIRQSFPCDHQPSP